MKRDTLTFKMAEASQQLPVRLRLKIVRKRSLADDVLVFDREISRENLAATTSVDGKVTFSSPLSALGVPSMGKGKYRVTLSAGVEFPGETILNREVVVGGLKDSAVLELKIN